MAKEKDIISEQDFNLKMLSNLAVPKKDSPGDSESDSMSEIEMGFDFESEEKNYDEELIDIAAFDESAADDRDKKKKSAISEEDIPDSAKAVSSDLPSPRADRDKRSDTH
jgi:hypothetical protein